jgi:hypothetical protein
MQICSIRPVSLGLILVFAALLHLSAGKNLRAQLYVANNGTDLPTTTGSFLDPFGTASYGLQRVFDNRSQMDVLIAVEIILFPGTYKDSGAANVSQLQVGAQTFSLSILSLSGANRAVVYALSTGYITVTSSNFTLNVTDVILVGSTAPIITVSSALVLLTRVDFVNVARAVSIEAGQCFIRSCVFINCTSDVGGAAIMATGGEVPPPPVSKAYPARLSSWTQPSTTIPSPS